MPENHSCPNLFPPNHWMLGAQAVCGTEEKAAPEPSVPRPERKEVRLGADIDRRRIDGRGSKHGFSQVVLVNHLEHIAGLHHGHKPPVRGQVEMVVRNDRRSAVMPRRVEAVLPRVGRLEVGRTLSILQDEGGHVVIFQADCQVVTFAIDPDIAIAAAWANDQAHAVRISGPMDAVGGRGDGTEGAVQSGRRSR